MKVRNLARICGVIVPLGCGASGVPVAIATFGLELLAIGRFSGELTNSRTEQT